MSDDRQGGEVEPGKLRCIWRTNEFGGLALFARFDGYVWELYADEAGEDCIGEAEDISDPDFWALDALVEHGGIPAWNDGKVVRRGRQK